MIEAKPRVASVGAAEAMGGGSVFDDDHDDGDAGDGDGDRPVTIARDDGPRGSVVLRRRHDAHAGEVWELITNGIFIMDSLETSTERLLASAALDAFTAASAPYRPARALSVVAAGLGLGFTVRELLEDGRVGRIDVVEIEPSVVSWVRSGLIPATAGALADPRVRTHVADLRRWLPECPPASIDVLVLDIDNGPDMLVHLDNSQVYGSAFLSTVKRTLRPGGVLATWSATRTPALAERLDQTFGNCEEIRRPVTREGREFDYFLYVASLPRP
jgi:spermidine synthase